ncbi:MULTISPECIES: LIC_13387 family protein [unclassified Streptomyces]|uniref:LIC_13387 family protein n=1 Tax=unclassified Streptomyces TaxID=2593676 RepID=UPI00344B7E2A
MNSAVTSHPLPPADSVRPFKVGAYGFVLLGLGHLALSAVAASAARTPERSAAERAMRESTLVLLGLERTVLDVFNGMSIAMAFFSITCGLLILAAVRHAPVLVQRRTAFGWIALAVSLAVLATALLLLPPPPIVVLTVCACAFALSLRRAATPAARASTGA